MCRPGSFHDRPVKVWMNAIKLLAMDPLKQRTPLLIGNDILD